MVFFLTFLVWALFAMTPAWAGPNEDLMRAIKSGDVNAAEQALAQGANVDARNRLGYTALMEAAIKGRPDIVKFLLAHGANVDATILVSPIPRQGHMTYWNYIRRIQERFDTIAENPVKRAGRVLFTFTINADGTSTWEALRESSGNRDLDKESLRVIQVANPYLPLPASLHKKSITTTWAFIFSHSSKVTVKNVNAQTASDLARENHHPAIVSLIQDHLFQQAQANRDYFCLNAQRYETLLARNLVSKNTYDEANSQCRQATTKIRLLKAQRMSSLQDHISPPIQLSAPGISSEEAQNIANQAAQTANSQSSGEIKKLQEENALILKQLEARQTSSAGPAPPTYHSPVDRPSFHRRENRNLYAVVIGVEHYTKPIPPAKFADRDGPSRLPHLFGAGGAP